MDADFYDPGTTLKGTGKGGCSACWAKRSRLIPRRRARASSYSATAADGLLGVCGGMVEAVGGRPQLTSGQDGRRCPVDTGAGFFGVRTRSAPSGAEALDRVR